MSDSWEIASTGHRVDDFDLLPDTQIGNPYARAGLREGAVTIYVNGQAWTPHQGLPRRVVRRAVISPDQ